MFDVNDDIYFCIDFVNVSLYVYFYIGFATIVNNISNK